MVTCGDGWITDEFGVGVSTAKNAHPALPTSIHQQSDCWKAEPGLRPSFAAILEVLAKYEDEGGEIEAPPNLNAMASGGCQCTIC